MLAEDARRERERRLEELNRLAAEEPEQSDDSLESSQLDKKENATVTLYDQMEHAALFKFHAYLPQKQKTNLPKLRMAVTKRLKKLKTA